MLFGRRNQLEKEVKFLKVENANLREEVNALKNEVMKKTNEKTAEKEKNIKVEEKLNALRDAYAALPETIKKWASVKLIANLLDVD